MQKICFLVTCAILLVTASFAQEGEAFFFQKTPEPMNPESGKVVVLETNGGEPGNGIFLREMISGGERIKGAPYTATAITENTQVLGDGNRIVHKSSAFIARDGQGRTRREENFGEVGGLHVNGGKIFFISDPTTGTDYVLNPDEQAARVVKREGGQREEPRITIQRRKLPEGEMRVHSPEWSAESKNESLGTQVIEGVTCEGHRETKVIPAGAIGNERPIEISSESWTSTDLHVLVLRKRNDPRLGETIYRLTNIKLGEPDPSLFQVPSGYKTTTITEPLLPRE